MSLYKTITVSPETKILIWKIDESYEELAQGIELTDHCQNRLDNTKSGISERSTSTCSSGLCGPRPLLRR